MSNYTHFLHYHVSLLQKFKVPALNYPPYKTERADLTENDQQFMTVLDGLCEDKRYSDCITNNGQWLIPRTISRYNHLMPFLSRDLL